MAIKLEDVKPTRVTFTLPTSGMTLTLRPFSLDDEIWMNEAYGDGIQKLFQECKFQEIFKIAFRMIENKDELKKRPVKIVNEEGDEKTVQIGGLQLLNAACHGFEEKMLVLTSLLNCIGISRPMMDQLVTDEAEAQKKSLLTHQTGDRFSTSSAPSTDGQPSTF